MQLKEFNIILDVKKHIQQEQFEVVQGDSFSNIVNITLIDGLNDFDLTGTNVEVVFSKSDGTTVQQTDIAIINSSKGKIQCVLKTNTIASPGKVLAEVRILEGETLLTSTRFEFFVRRSLMSDDTIESTNEFPILTQLISTTEGLIEQIEQIEAQVPENIVTQLTDITDIVSQLQTGLVDLESNLTTHEADMAYQTPTIVDTQIIISKQSDTNRLYFKLNNDLSGGNITISLDGGVSELPLKDIEGNNVTELEKGFVEVVAEASFFILRPRGSGGGINDTLPPQIDNFNATAGNGKIDLTWTISDTTYLDGYVFTYKENGIPSGVNDGVKIIADKASTSSQITGLENDILYYVRAFPYNSKKQYQTEYRVISATPNSGIPINELPVGAKVKFGKYKVESSAIESMIWLIASKNHPGYPTSSVTLLTEKIIDLRGFDAKEPSNSNTDRQTSGNNRYLHSNLRQWLNKEGYPWYVNQHGADAPPNDAGMNQPTGYDDEPGFLSNFSENELAAILDTTLTVAKNTVTDGGGSETVVDKVFLLSTTEVGLANENSIVEGDLIPLFSNDASRLSYLTQQAFDNTLSGGKPAGIGSAWNWWLRTPDASLSRFVRYVNPFGTLSSTHAFSGYLGVRPALNLKSDILVSNNVDSDGCYVVLT